MTVRTKQDYIDALNALIPDNSTQQISPLDIRTALGDLADSVSLFLVDTDIVALNIASEDTRTTRVGDTALSKIDLAGHSSQDNSAFGYAALFGNYNGKDNTALGSHALGCNLYGSENVAVGFNALAANLTGSGNVGVGNYTLQLNKTGNFNIAIGNAAGYYIGPNDNYKFYLGSYNQDSSSLCGAVSGSGAPPLLFGDLQGLSLGIGVNSLHAYGALQVAGNASPSQNKVFNLGHPSYSWNGAHIASGIGYSDSGNFYIVKTSPLGGQYTQQTRAVFTSGGLIGFGDVVPATSDLVTVGGNIVPSVDLTYNLGAPNLKWNAYLANLTVSGIANINNLNYNTITSNLYQAKTLFLATSGNFTGGVPTVGFMPDEGIDGGGFEISSSGSTYQRNYVFLYKFPDQGLTHLEQDSPFSRSRWLSNISIAVTGGCHIQTNRVLGDERVALVSESGGGYGLFIRSNQSTPSSTKVWLGSEDHIGANYSYASDINIIGPSGNSNDFILSIGSPGSGVRVGQRLTTRVSGAMVGFGNEYFDTSNPSTDRLSTIVYNGQSNILEAMTFVRNVNPLTGLVGITNIQHAPSSTPIIPQTIFNVQATSRMEARFSTISAAEKSRLQLIGNGNTKVSGVQLSYDPSMDSLQGNGFTNNVVVSLDLFRASGTTGIESGVFSVTEKGFVGIGRNIASADPLTISHNAVNSGTIALKQQATIPTVTATFGKIYVKPYVVAGTQTQSLYLLDSAGHEFNIVRNQNDTQSSLLYGDSLGNTYGGWYSPVGRPTNSCTANTALGYTSLSGITTGSNNVAIGNAALKMNQAGSNNVVVGNSSFLININGNNNISVGNYNAQLALSNSNCILIGSGLSPTGGMSDSTFLLGFGNAPLVQGSFSSRTFGVNNGKFFVGSQSGDQTFSISTPLASRYITYLDIQDNVNTGSISGAAALRFLDAASTAHTLVMFDHQASGMTRVPTYSSPTSPRPFVEISGDVKVLGAIRFSDGSYAESASAITIQGGTGIYVSGGLVNLDYDNLIPADLINTIDVTNSFVGISVFDGSRFKVGKLTLQELGSFVGSGYASVSTNCNHIFTDAVNNPLVDRINNSNDVFIGCGVGQAATGWKHTVMIGTSAGAGATTPNVGLATDTACVFLGYKAGYQSLNAQNSIFIGTDAGAQTTDASVSTFIGPNAGQNSQFSNSVGIGQNALRSLTSPVIGGTGNIEIVAGLLSDSDRLMYNLSASNKLNIGNSIAGDIGQQRVSIGAATLYPTSPLTVAKNSVLPGHSGLSYIQDWYCNGVFVAGIGCDGSMYGTEGLPNIVEGNMRDQILRPSLNSTPLSGVLIVKDSTWNTIGTVYVVNRDTTMSIPAGSFVVAHKVNGTYRPITVACSGV